MSFFDIFSLAAPLPNSTEAYRTAYAGGSRSINSQSTSRSSSPPPSPPKHSKSHLARLRSSSSSEAAYNELTSSRPPAEPRYPRSQESRSKAVKPKAECTAALPARQPRARRSKKHTLPASQPRSHAWTVDEITHTTPVLPASAYNYQPYHPAPSPAIVPWTKRDLYRQVMSTAPLIFLSCNLTNPIHLASILAHGCSKEVVDQIAEMMTPAVLTASADTSSKGEVGGVLVGGLAWAAQKLLDTVMRRRYGKQYESRVEEVEVAVEGGGSVIVPAYVYRRAEI